MANTDVDLTSKMEVLTNQERTNGFTHKWKIKYTDIDEGSGATDTVTASLMASPVDFVVTKAAINVVTAFTGSGGLAVEVGTDGDPNNFITSTSVLTAGPTITGAGATPTTLAGSFAAASDAIEALFTNSVSGSPSALTAGEIDIYLGVLNLNDVG